MDGWVHGVWGHDPFEAYKWSWDDSKMILLLLLFCYFDVFLMGVYMSCAVHGGEGDMQFCRKHEITLSAHQLVFHLRCSLKKNDFGEKHYKKKQLRSKLELFFTSIQKQMECDPNSCDCWLFKVGALCCIFCIICYLLFISSWDQTWWCVYCI